MIWLVFTLGASLLWGIGNGFAKIGSKDISSLWNNIISILIGIFIWIPIAVIGSNFHFTVPSPLLLFLIFLTAACYASYFYAILKGNLALTSTVFHTYAVFTVILSFIFLHERITILQLQGIIITILGGIFVVVPPKNATKTVHNYIWVFWGLTGAILEGVGDFFAKVTVDKVGAYSQMFFLVIMFLIVLIFNVLFDKKGRKLPKFSHKVFLPTILGVAFVVGGQALLFFAYLYGKASLVTPISSALPVTTIIAILFLKEKVTKIQAIGIFATITGVILISLKV